MVLILLCIPFAILGAAENPVVSSLKEIPSLRKLCARVMSRCELGDRERWDSNLREIVIADIVEAVCFKIDADYQGMVEELTAEAGNNADLMEATGIFLRRDFTTINADLHCMKHELSQLDFKTLRYMHAACASWRHKQKHIVQSGLAYAIVYAGLSETMKYHLFDLSLISRTDAVSITRKVRQRKEEPKKKPKCTVM